MKDILELSAYLQPEMVVDLTAKNKSELLEKLISHLASSSKVLDPELMKTAIIEREKAMSTGIGNGLAVPHARTNAVSDFVITVARVIPAIDFGADDKIPVSLVFLIVATEKQDAEYIRLLSRLMLRLRNEEFLHSITTAKNTTEIYNLIRETK